MVQNLQQSLPMEKEGDVLKLDVDPASHPAWTGGNAQIRENAGQVARFKKKFGNIKV